MSGKPTTGGFEKTPGWLDWYTGPSQPQCDAPADPLAAAGNQRHLRRLVTCVAGQELEIDQAAQGMILGRHHQQDVVRLRPLQPVPNGRDVVVSFKIDDLFHFVGYITPSRSPG